MKSSTMRPKRSLSGAQSPVVSVRLSRLGERTRVLKLRVGTTINDLVKNEALERSSIRVNKRPVRLASKLKSGDVVVVVPQAIVGGGSGRYDHLNLDDCRRRMSAKDFRVFVDFVGADTLGFTDADLEA
jgi:molybdopterin converting factor small subunit